MGKGLSSLLLHTYVLRPAPVNRATPLLRRGHNQAFLGRATFLALLPPCREPSFPNLFSALKLSSEAASDSAFKTQFWLNGTEAHRSQMHTCPHGDPATVSPAMVLPCPHHLLPASFVVNTHLLFTWAYDRVLGLGRLQRGQSHWASETLPSPHPLRNSTSGQGK